MSIAKTRLLRLALCFSLLGCFVLLNPLAAYDCGCAGQCDYDCECGPDCACEADEGYDEECPADEEEECDEECDSCNKDPCFGNCMPCECFIDGFSVGIDYLYWNPCLTGLHYAVKRKSFDDAADRLKHDYHYVCASSASGFRVNWNTKFTTEGLFFRAAYTDVGFHDKGCVTSQTSGSIVLTHGTPDGFAAVSRATAYWDAKYQTVEAAFIYALDLDILKLTPYAGVDVLMYDNKLKTEGCDDLVVDEVTSVIRKHQQYFGAGPMIGFGANYGFNDCISAFFDVNASLFLGGAEEKDRFYQKIGTAAATNTYWKSRDCYCFPGWHLMLGLASQSTLCGLDVGFRIGYEFVQYTNAPWFFDYENGDDGIISAVNANNLTLRGLFVGVNVGF